MLSYDEPALLARMRRVDSVGRTLLAASAIDRLMSARTRGGPAQDEDGLRRLRGSLDALWGHVCGERVDRKRTHKDLLAIENLMSAEDSEFFDDDLAASIAYGFRHLLSDDPQEVMWALRRVFEAANHVADEDPSVPPYNEIGPLAMANPHPVVQAEIARQERDLVEVERIGAALSSDDVERIRSRSRTEGFVSIA